MSKNDPAERTVRDIRRKTRKQYTAEEKIRIVVSGLRGEESIAALCRHEGIAEGLYYSWSKEFLEAGKKRLAGDTGRQANSGEVKVLRQEMRDLKELVAELSLENRLNAVTDRDPMRRRRGHQRCSRAVCDPRESEVRKAMVSSRPGALSPRVCLRYVHALGPGAVSRHWKLFVGASPYPTPRGRSDRTPPCHRTCGTPVPRRTPGSGRVFGMRCSWLRKSAHKWWTLMLTRWSKFDLRHHRFIQYLNNDQGLQALETKLESRLRRLFHMPSH